MGICIIACFTWVLGEKEEQELFGSLLSKSRQLQGVEDGLGTKIRALKTNVEKEKIIRKKKKNSPKKKKSNKKKKNTKKKKKPKKKTKAPTKKPTKKKTKAPTRKPTTKKKKSKCPINHNRKCAKCSQNQKKKCLENCSFLKRTNVLRNLIPKNLRK